MYDSGQPPGKISLKYYKCRHKVEVKAVVRIINENSYHKSEFYKFKDNILIIT